MNGEKPEAFDCLGNVFDFRRDTAIVSCGCKATSWQSERRTIAQTFGYQAI